MENAVDKISSTAYCCQCSWLTVKPPGGGGGGSNTLLLTSVAGAEKLKWVCAGHI